MGFQSTKLAEEFNLKRVIPHVTYCITGDVSVARFKEIDNFVFKWVDFFHRAPQIVLDSVQLTPEGEVNSSGYIPRREASRYISTALHRPRGG